MILSDGTDTDKVFIVCIRKNCESLQEIHRLSEFSGMNYLLGYILSLDDVLPHLNGPIGNTAWRYEFVDPETAWQDRLVDED